MYRHLVFLGTAQATLPAAELVTNLPEVGDITKYPFQMYSGYAKVTETKQLHYVLLTS